MCVQESVAELPPAELEFTASTLPSPPVVQFPTRVTLGEAVTAAGLRTAATMTWRLTLPE